MGSVHIGWKFFKRVVDTIDGSQESVYIKNIYAINAGQYLQFLFMYLMFLFAIKLYDIIQLYSLHLCTHAGLCPLQVLWRHIVKVY